MVICTEPEFLFVLIDGRSNFICRLKGGEMERQSITHDLQKNRNNLAYMALPQTPDPKPSEDLFIPEMDAGRDHALRA